MQIEILKHDWQLDALEQEWSLLLQTSACRSPFLRHEYLSTWWRTRGGGEWPSAELCLVVARGERGELTGIAPLFFAHNQQGEAALMLLGSIEISDYLDLIVSQDHLPVFLDAVLELLASPDGPPFHVLDWYNLLDSSPTLAALQSAALRRGWHYQQESLQACPQIALPGDWETYLAGIDKKQRHEIRRKLRRAGEYPQPVRWYIVEDEARLDEEIEAFFQLMAYDPQKQAFLTPAMRSQMRQSIWAAFRGGWLQLAFVEVAGEKGAAYLNFDAGKVIWVYNSGLNPAFRELSLGWVLLARLIEWAIENGHTSFDFMRGDEEYKYRFGAQDRHVVRAQVRC